MRSGFPGELEAGGRTGQLQFTITPWHSFSRLGFQDKPLVKWLLFESGELFVDGLLSPSCLVPHPFLEALVCPATYLFLSCVLHRHTHTLCIFSHMHIHTYIHQGENIVAYGFVALLYLIKIPNSILVMQETLSSL